MRNFTKQISGEAEPRTFRFDVASGSLHTDMELENKQGGFPDQAEVRITEESAKTDPHHEKYWAQTYVEREAYRLCEDEGISLDEAFAKVNGHPPPVATNGKPPQRDIDTVELEYLPSEPNAMSPIAAVVITNQQLILEISFQLLDQYISEEDANYKMLQFLKEKIEGFNEQEIVI